MTRFGCLILLLVIVCPSLQEKGTRSGLQVNTTANLQCYSSCDQRYPPSRTDTWLACHRGCRLASMLSRLASGKQKKEVAKSCLAACSEAYNDTQDETACHSGCGHHAKPEKAVSMKGRPANNKSVDAGTRKQKDDKKKVLNLPSPNHPDTIPANRILWAKTVVDEQDVNSSSDETISVSDFFPSLNNPLNLISRIWPKNLLIPGITISKSTVTYVSEEEPATPDAEPAIKSEVSQSFPSKSDPVAKSVEKEIPVKLVHPAKQQQDENRKIPDFRTPTGKTAAVEIKVNPAVDPFYPVTATGLLGQLELLVIVLLISISVSFLVILLMLHCATGQRDYSPVSTSDNDDAKDDEGQRLVSTSCTSEDERDESSGRQNSLYSRLIHTGLLPPSYEEAQQHRNNRNQSLKQPLLLALDV